MISNWNKQAKLRIDDIEIIELGIIDIKIEILIQIDQNDAHEIYSTVSFCELDTLAMVMIYEGWKDYLSNNHPL